MKDAGCTICGAKAGFLLKKDGYDLYECRRCDHLLVHPVPSESQLKKLYAGGYHADLSVDFTQHRFREAFRDRVHAVHPLRKGKLLDVGCSNGEFLYLAQQAGYNALGVDLNEATLGIARRNGLRVKRMSLERLEFPASSFDVVHLGDVIEHVRNPRKSTKQIRAILKPGGILIVSTPNKDCFFVKASYLLYSLFRIPWAHPTPPHHLNQFSERSLRLLLEQEGFEVVEVWFNRSQYLYELGATGVFRKLRASVRSRSVKAVGYAALGAVVAIVYGILAVVSAPLKRQQEMTVIARKAGV